MISTVVITEDDQETLDFLRDFFEMLGMMVVACPDGTQAPACIAEHHPAVVILDVYLDGMTGVDVLHRLRADPAMQTVPVIFFSGSEHKLRQLLPDYTAHGATFVPKPNIEKLQAVVQHLVQQSA